MKQFFNDNSEFYPTPDNVLDKMCTLIKNKSVRYILEPSAGDGRICDKLQSYLGSRYKKLPIDCIEQDKNLQSILKDKDYNIVGNNFLDYNGETLYDLIIMNPPFSQGCNHLLKAIQILYSGQIICILNAETLRNPYSKERQLLLRLIESNSENSIEYIENAFTDADRKTNVEVVLVSIIKKPDIITDFFQLDSDKLTKDYESVYVENEHSENSVTIKQSKIEELVRNYNNAVETSKDSIIKQAKAQYYKQLLILNNDYHSTLLDIKELVNTEIKTLRKIAWGNICTLSDFSKIMTKKVREEFETKKDEISKLEFNESNIKEFLKQLYLSQHEIMEQSLLEVFDLFTRYSSDNVIHYEGWKSNNKFEIGKTDKDGKFLKRRVVLPYLVKQNWNNTKMEFYSYNAEQTLNDIDNVLHRLEGKYDINPNERIYNTLYKNNLEVGVKHSSRYFDIRVYKKGTVHFYFKDAKLLQRLNIQAGKLRNWLPFDDNDIDVTLLKLAYEG